MPLTDVMRKPADLPGSATGRLLAVDLFRGIAIAGMVFYHFFWDLSFNGLIDADVVNGPWWKASALLIAGTFVALVGFNLVLSVRSGFRHGPYLRRLAVIVLGAGLVSLGTYLLVPDEFVFFGILHAIALMSVLALPLLWAPVWLTAITALLSLAAPTFLTLPLFDTLGLVWLGLSPNSISTVDFVPILPWFGIVLGGIVAGRMFVSHGLDVMAVRWRPSDRLLLVLMFVGRRSLLVYLVHQPLLFGGLMLAVEVSGAPSKVGGDFIFECRRVYHPAASHPSAADRYCRCLASGAKAAHLIDQVMANRLNGREIDQWLAVADRCRLAGPPSG